MRLTNRQKTTIQQTLKRYFGEASHILLLGSRTDDGALGGDIDLYIEPELDDPDTLVDAKLNALAELHAKLGDQKIDLVIHRTQTPELAIHRSAKASGIPL